VTDSTWPGQADGLETTTRAAGRLHVTPETIRTWVAEGKLRGMYLSPRLLLIDSATVDALARIRGEQPCS
jgi:hypothetical protein